MPHPNVARNRMFDEASRNQRNTAAQWMTANYNHAARRKTAQQEEGLPGGFLIGFVGGQAIVIGMVYLFGSEIYDFIAKTF